jgi:hypothetical protein
MHLPLFRERIVGVPTMYLVINRQLATATPNAQDIHTNIVAVLIAICLVISL